MVKYYLLTDPVNRGTIVKAEGHKQFLYLYGEDKWIATGILLLYFTEGHMFYEKYIYIEESKANFLQNNMLEVLSGINQCLMVELSKKGIEEPFVFSDLETNIMYLLFILNDVSILDNVNKKIGNQRIQCGLKRLYDNFDLDEENCIVELRKNRSTQQIAKAYLESMLSKGEISASRFASLVEILEHKR